MSNLNDLVASGEPENWLIVRDLIATERIQPDRIAQIYRDHPEFAAWIRREHE